MNIINNKIKIFGDEFEIYEECTFNNFSNIRWYLLNLGINETIAALPWNISDDNFEYLKEIFGAGTKSPMHQAYFIVIAHRNYNHIKSIIQRL